MFREIELDIVSKNDLYVCGRLTISKMRELAPWFNGKKNLKLNCQSISRTAAEKLRATLKKNKSIETIELYNLELKPELIELFKEIFLNKNFKSISLSFISLTPDDNALLKAIVRRGCAEDGILEKLYVNSLQWHPNVYVNFLKALTELLYKSTTLQELAIPFHPWDEENFAIAINNNSLKKITLVIQNFDCIYAAFLIELLQAIKKILEIEMYFSKPTIYYKEPKIFTLFLNTFPFVTGITGELSEELKFELAPLCERNKAIMNPQTDPVIKARLLSNISRAQEKLLEKFRFNNDIWLYRTPKLVELAASKVAKLDVYNSAILPCELYPKVENYCGFWSKPQSKRPYENDEHELNKRQCTDETTVGADLRVCPY